jgi:hypothetical protein
LLSVVLAAGVTGAQALAQSWTSQGPIPRFGHSAVLDPSTNRMIVFGGSPATANETAPLNDFGDLWILQGAGAAISVWTQLKPTGAKPAARLEHGAVYDPTSNRMILFGGGLGQASPCANDSWTLINANGTGGTPAWIQVSPAGSPPAPRLRFASAYDSITNTLIVFGGNDCFSGFFNDAAVLSHANGLGGTPTWTTLNPSGALPSARADVSGVYDPSSNRLIIFGGGGLNEVWVLTNANGSGGTPQWIQLSPTGGPPSGRSSQTAVYDSVNNRLTIFGGSSSAGFLNDAWVLSNANGIGGSPAWTQLGPFSTFPQARTLHTAVYLPAKNKMVVFGGLTSSTSSGDVNTNDVFVLNHANGLK